MPLPAARKCEKILNIPIPSTFPILHLNCRKTIEPSFILQMNSVVYDMDIPVDYTIDIESMGNGIAFNHDNESEGELNFILLELRNNI